MRFGILVMVAGCEMHSVEYLSPDGGSGTETAPRWASRVIGNPGFPGLIGELTIEQSVGARVFTADFALRGDQAGAVRPWFVHYGSCVTYGVIVGEATAYPPLEIAADGTGVTAARIAEELDDQHFYFVTVHESAAALSTLIACGELARSN